MNQTFDPVSQPLWCPYCGHDAKYAWAMDTDQHAYYCSNWECRRNKWGCKGGVVDENYSYWRKTKAGALAAWNAVKPPKLSTWWKRFLYGE